MKYFIITIIAAVFLITCSGLGAADVLPNPVPENQVFTTTSIIEAVGVVSESTSVVWEIGDVGLTSLPNPTVTSLDPLTIRSGSIAYVTYSDTITTNGGQISEVKSFSMDTGAKTEGLFNIETNKVLTYTSQNGSHLMGAESYVLDVAGNWSYGLDDIVCVFSRNNDQTIPAFCNKVTASSRLTSFTTAQIQSIGGVLAVGVNSDDPAALNYEISVTPDANSASGYADGIVSTTFTISVMEGRSDGAIITTADREVGGGLWVYFLWPGIHNSWRYIDSSGAFFLERWTTPFPSYCDQVMLLDSSKMIMASALVCDGDRLEGPVVTTSPPGSNFADYGYTIVANDDLTYTLTVDLVNYLGMEPGVYTIDSFNQNPDGVLLTHPIEPYLTGYDELAATLTYIDTATVAGGISTFNKVFSYQSGIDCVNC